MSEPSKIQFEALAAHALSLGFDQCRIASPDAIPDAPQRLEEFLEQGMHGDMAWLEERKEQRSNPSVLWPSVKSVIMLGFNYGPDTDPLEILTQKNLGAISVYAQNRDYHDIIKKKLKTLARWLIQEGGGDVKVFVDTAPVMEKPLGEAAGLGWQGKHTNLVSRELGSWFFLGAIFSTLDLQPSGSESDHCGACTRCLDCCPTNAFPAPYKLDARRCISYLTIEHKGPIPLEFRKPMGNRIYGCDDCLAVCPWNKFAKIASEAKLKARDELRAPRLEALARLDDTSFRALFSGSPIKRIGRDHFIRNVMIAIGNSKNDNLIPVAEENLQDTSPLVRGASIWALAQLKPRDQFEQLRLHHMPNETDDTALSEWNASRG